MSNDYRPEITDWVARNVQTEVRRSEFQLRDLYNAGAGRTILDVAASALSEAIAGLNRHGNSLTVGLTLYLRDADRQNMRNVPTTPEHMRQQLALDSSPTLHLFEWGESIFDDSIEVFEAPLRFALFEPALAGVYCSYGYLHRRADLSPSRFVHARYYLEDYLPLVPDWWRPRIPVPPLKELEEHRSATFTPPNLSECVRHWLELVRQRAGAIDVDGMNDYELAGIHIDDLIGRNLIRGEFLTLPLRAFDRLVEQLPQFLAGTIPALTIYLADSPGHEAPSTYLELESQLDGLTPPELSILSRPLPVPEGGTVEDPRGGLRVSSIPFAEDFIDLSRDMRTELRSFPAAENPTMVSRRLIVWHNPDTGEL